VKRQKGSHRARKQIEKAAMELRENGNLQVIGGSGFCVGDTHVKYPIGYQDARFVINKEGVFVGIVCDGCSTTSDSFTQNQVGAALAAELIALRVFRRISSKMKSGKLDFDQVLSDVGRRAFQFFRNIIREMKRASPEFFDREKFLQEKLLFTVVGLVVAKENYWIFGCGDGCFGINNDIVTLETTPETQFFMRSIIKNRKLGGFKIHKTDLIKDSDTLWIASDGLLSLFDKDAAKLDFEEFLHHNLTCKMSPGGVDQTIRPFRHLSRKHPRLFRDDATIVVAKVRQSSTGNETKVPKEISK